MITQRHLERFGAAFFKSTWEITGPAVVKSVLHFFSSGYIPKSMATAVIHLVPKGNCPNKVSDYRAISYCKVIYKIILKTICSRLSKILPDIISGNQSAFVCGRSIIDNIMLRQDLVYGSERKGLSPRCMAKIDIRKAFDTMN